MCQLGEVELYFPVFSFLYLLVRVGHKRFLWEIWRVEVKQQRFCSSYMFCLVTLKWSGGWACSYFIFPWSSFSFPDSWARYVFNSMVMKGPSCCPILLRSEAAKIDRFQFIYVIVCSSLLVELYSHLPNCLPWGLQVPTSEDNRLT